MKRNLLLKRILSAILAIILLVSTIPVSLAVQDQYPAERINNVTRKEFYSKDYIDAESTLIIGEDKSLRKENEKHFRHKDGSYSAVLYAEPVHYRDSSGNWEDIDNHLIAKTEENGKVSYSPVASGVNVSAPQTFSDGQTIIVEKDGYKLELGILTDRMINDTQPGIIGSSEIPIGESGSINTNDIMSAALLENTLSEIQGAIREEENIGFDFANTENLSVEEANIQAVYVNTHDSTVSYSDLLHGDDLEYTVSPSRIKESIIIDEKKTSMYMHFLWYITD